MVKGTWKGVVVSNVERPEIMIDYSYDTVRLGVLHGFHLEIPESATIEKARDSLGWNTVFKITLRNGEICYYYLYHGDDPWYPSVLRPSSVDEFLKYKKEE
jgi:hypothetical protein